ncbi:MAG: M24 family metallopeptidase [Candidatus Kariarchaeaceae archaeon]
MLSDDEFKNRTKKVQETLEKEKLDYYIVGLEVNFRYLFKAIASPSERLTLGIIPNTGEPILVCPSFEKSRMEKTTTFNDIKTWDEDQNPYDLASEILFLKKADQIKIAVSPNLPFFSYTRLKNNLKDTEFVSGEKLIHELRKTKSEAEKAALSKASEISAAVISETILNLSPGATELEVQKKVMDELTIRSGEPSWALVQSGPNSAIPHMHSSARVIRENDIVLIDAGTSIEGYWGDITCTTTLDKNNKEFIKIYDIVYEANQRGVDSAKAGTTGEEVDYATRSFIEKKGYGEFFTHRTGHGIGLEVHEEPYIVKGNNQPLLEGNVHSIEPGIYLPNKFGVRIEDDVIVTQKTGKRLSKPLRRLWE